MIKNKNLPKFQFIEEDKSQPAENPILDNNFLRDMLQTTSLIDNDLMHRARMDWFESDYVVERYRNYGYNHRLDAKIAVPMREFMDYERYNNNPNGINHFKEHLKKQLTLRLVEDMINNNMVEFIEYIDYPSNQFRMEARIRR